METSKKYVIIFARDDKGEEIKFRFVLSTCKGLTDDSARLLKAINALDGIDGLQAMGRYSADIVIGRAFNPDEVIAELEKLLGSMLSPIITPKLVV
jgi:hypothetical protein